MVEMFETNKIPVNKDKLIKLFFSQEEINKEEELSLNFYKFMEFALSKEKDQAFRAFMRDVKQVIEKQHLESIQEDEGYIVLI